MPWILFIKETYINIFDSKVYKIKMNILVIQNRMGIGDMIIFLPFIEALSKKFNSKVVCLVKKSSKANEIFENNKYIKEFIFLDRDKGKGNHDGILGTFNLISKIKNYKFDKIFIFNSSFRFYLISKLSGATEVFHYPLFKKKKQHIIYTAQEFLKKSANLNVDSNPIIDITKDLIINTKNKYKINSLQKNFLLGIGGSGPTKRVSSKIFLEAMNLISEKYDCKFFLATGKSEGEQKILNEIMNTKFKKKCIPLDGLNIKNILPIIKNCNLSICNDSSFSHLSAALGLPTIVLMADTPLIYGSYSSRMYPIIPDGLETVTHNTLGKDKINAKKIFSKLIELLN